MFRGLIIRNLGWLAPLLLLGCTFTPSSENINPIVPFGSTPIGFTVNINDLSPTTSYLLINSTLFTYKLKDLVNPKMNFEVLVDGSSYTKISNATVASFILDPGAFGDGPHKVTLKMNIRTRTGSVADLTVGEYYAVETSFSVLIDRVPPPVIAAPTAAYENGFLTVRWNTPTKNNYVLVLNREYVGAYINIRDSIVSNTQTSFADPGYVGGNITYHIVARSFAFSFELGKVTFNQSPLDAKITYGADQIAHVSWTHSLIDLNATQVSISGHVTKKMALTQSADVSMDTLRLGDHMNYFIAISRNKFQNQTSTQIIPLNTPANIKPFNTMVMMPQHNKLLVATTKKIYRYSLPGIVLEDSLAAQGITDGDINSFTVSPDETKGIFAGGTILASFNPLDFTTHAVFTGLFTATIAATFTNSPIVGVSVGNLSNDGQLSLDISKGNVVAMVYDINTNTVKWGSPPFSSFPAILPLVISNDGNYFAFDYPNQPISLVYKRAAGSYSSIGYVDQGRKFFRNGASELINTALISNYPSPSTPVISIYNLNAPPALPNGTFVKARSVTLPSTRNQESITSLAYDDIAQTLYSQYQYDYSTIRLLDINDFHETKTMKALTNAGKHLYTNHYHLLTRGFIQAEP